MNIFHPRVDNRFDKNGITGTQFPSYEYTLALAYQFFNEHDWVFRLLSFLIYLGGLSAIYFLILQLFNSREMAFFAAWTYLWLPDLFYFSITPLPDTFALSASIAGLLFFLKWEDQKSLGYYWLSLFFILLGGLTKIQFLAVGFPIAGIILLKKDFSAKKIISYTFFALVAVSVTLLWYRYALLMIERSGLKDIGIEFRPVADFYKALYILGLNIFSTIPELLLGYPTAVLLLVGLFFFIKLRKWNNKLFYPVLIWALALMMYHLIELAQMIDHVYYMMPYIPLVLIIIAFSGRELLRKKQYSFLIFLLIAQPVFIFLTIVPHQWFNSKKKVPKEFYDESMRQKLIQAVPPSALCIVGPDISRCIDFYFLEKKGFGFVDKNDLKERQNGKITIQDYIDRGASYLFTNDAQLENDSLLVSFISSKVATVGDFRVFELRKPVAIVPIIQ